MSRRVTLIPGDGIGPAAAGAALAVLQAAGAGVVAKPGTPTPEAPHSGTFFD